MLTKILAFIIAGVAMVLAIAISTQNNLAVGQPFLIALALPFVFVGFVNLIFEVGWGLFIKAHKGAIYAKTKLRKDLVKEGMKIVYTRYVGGILCIVASLILGLVNIVAVMGGQVHTLQSSLTVTVEASSVDIATNLDDLIQDKKDLERLKLEEEVKWKSKKAELNRTMNILYPLMVDRVKSAEYADYKTQESKYEGNIVVHNQKIEAKQKEIEAARTNNLRAKTTESAKDNAYVGSIYAFIADVFNIEMFIVQFWMTALPSLFLDIISCVSLSLAIYSRTNKEG